MTDTQDRNNHATPAARINPITALLEFFSSVKLGITLLIILFFYSWLGSAGIFYPTLKDHGLEWYHVMIRQYRVFELTEFEWFHTWFFIANCALICINLTVVTIRKIPFNTIKLGVWMIHSGIIIMAIGSVIYFSTKVEGDSPVIRRSIDVALPTGQSTSIPVLLNATSEIDTTQGTWRFAIASALPEYELLTPGYEGQTTLAVTLEITPPNAEPVYRQLLDGMPQFTEDSVRVQNAAPGARPFARTRNLAEYNNQPLALPQVQATLAPLPQTYFWIKDSFALAHRPAGSTEPWTHMPIDGMPRYNDYVPREAVGTPAERLIWPPSGVDRYPIFGLNIPVADADPTGPAYTVLGYLRYATQDSRWLQGPPEAPLNPAADVAVVLSDGTEARRQLLALDPELQDNFEGQVGFRWVSDEDELTRLAAAAGNATITVTVDGESFTIPAASPITDEIPDFTPLGDTGFAIRVRQLNLGLQLSQSEPPIDLAVAEYINPEGNTVTRWVFGDPSATVDLDPDRGPDELGTVPPDDRLTTLLAPGEPNHIIAAGPVVQGVVLLDRNNPAPGRPLMPGAGVDVGGAELVLRAFNDRAVEDTRPVVIPREQRDANVERSLAAAKALVQIDTIDGPQAHWIPFHPYSFDDPRLYLSDLGRFRPHTYTAPDGNEYEVIFTRERRELPSPVALDDFNLIAHVGGFTGETGSIRDWQSVLRFGDDYDAAQPRTVRVNGPQEVDGLWYFQSFWDAPREQTPGKLFTGLGVGNREGVYTALIGSTLSVIGMIYTFYIKPIIQRRRAQHALAHARSNA